MNQSAISRDSDLLFPAQSVVTVAIDQSDKRFPVHRIFCVGRNYQAHAAEMGDQIDKSTMEPFYFIKDRSAIAAAGQALSYPPQTEDYHYEMEMVVAIGAKGFEIDQEDADNLIFGYACGLDMTRRDLQKKGKDQRRPWDLGKNFEQSAVIGPIYPKAITGELTDGKIELRVNGETKQHSDLSSLIWNPREVIAHLSRFYHLEPGDLIYTGTPEGVGPTVPGDRLEGEIEGLGSIQVSIR